MTDDESKKIRVELDHEQKVIHLGCWFYDLKGVLIAEATDEDKSKYHCGKYMTYPIVDDDWAVRDDECISDGIAMLTVGRKGDTILLGNLSEIFDYNAEEGDCEYSEILVDLERHGITVSNRTEENPQEELPTTITLEIYKISKEEDIYRIDCDLDGYYIPRRFCHVGKDGHLYLNTKESENETKYKYLRIVQQIADDVCSISWFFNKYPLRVRCVTTDSDCESETDVVKSLPADWHPSILMLEDDVNNEIQCQDERSQKCFFRHKRPI